MKLINLKRSNKTFFSNLIGVKKRKSANLQLSAIRGKYNQVICQQPSETGTARYQTQPETQNFGITEDCGSPSVLQCDTRQILPAGRPLQTTLFCCCPNRLMFYLRAHLKDLSVTLIRAGGECLAVFSVNPKAFCPRRPRFIGKKSGYICSRNLLPDPTS